MLIAAMLAAVQPVPLVSRTPWVVRAEENMCLLERTYTLDDKRKITLVFMPLLDLGSMELFVLEDSTSGRQYSGVFKARVGPVVQEYNGPYFSVRQDKSGLRMTRLTIDRSMLDVLKTGDALRIEAKPVDAAFIIPGPDKARAALKVCVDGLKKSWGIDPVKQEQLASPLEGNPARYFSTSSYPTEAYQKGVYGRVIALLIVDDKGAVSNCRILSSAGQLLNEGTCKAAMRIRFKPARDAAGAPMASTYTLPVRWVLPGVEG